MSRKSTSGFITGKPIKLEVAQKGRDYSQTEDSQLSDELIRDYILERRKSLQGPSKSTTSS